MEAAVSQSNSRSTDTSTEQYSTFLVSGRLYGIDVVKVQEVVKPMPMTTVPLAPNFVKGLINLRGQVATAIGLRELFDLEPGHRDQLMNVVCNHNGNLVSLLVDEIGDVMEVEKSGFESTPQTVSTNVKKFMTGVFKQPDSILSILDLENIFGFINPK